MKPRRKNQKPQRPRMTYPIYYAIFHARLDGWSWDRISQCCGFSTRTCRDWIRKRGQGLTPPTFNQLSEQL